MLLVVRRLQELGRPKEKTAVHVVCPPPETRKAYDDSVDRALLSKVLAQVGVPEEMHHKFSPTSRRHASPGPHDGVILGPGLE